MTTATMIDQTTPSTDDAAPLHLLVITASPRPRRFGPTVTSWFLRQVERQDAFTFSHIDIAALDVPAGIEPTGAAQQQQLEQIGAQISAADAIVIVTPEYNHGYPGTLKNLIDHFREHWAATPVAFVCYGGTSGGLRAVEQLRLVFAELHTMTLRDVISFHYPHGTFDAAGNPPDATERAETASHLLRVLRWWATALKAARNQRPYPGELA